MTELTVKEKNKSRHVRFKIEFKNILDLNDIPQFQENFIQFEKSGKNITFERRVFINDDKTNKKEDPENIFEKLVINLVEEGLSHIKFRFELETPYKIANSNADWTPGDNRAVWKLRLSDVMYQNEVDMMLSTK